jgi:hypothetical protein
MRHRDRYPADPHFGCCAHSAQSLRRSQFLHALADMGAQQMIVDARMTLLTGTSWRAFLWGRKEPSSLVLRSMFLSLSPGVAVPLGPSGPCGEVPPPPPSSGFLVPCACAKAHSNPRKRCGEAGYRSLCLMHAKHALYHLSYIPWYNSEPYRQY